MMMMMMIQIPIIIEFYDFIACIIFFSSYPIIGSRKILQKEWEFNVAVNQLFIHFKKAYGSLKMELFNNIIV
jgi:hypothetical protein